MLRRTIGAGGAGRRVAPSPCRRRRASAIPGAMLVKKYGNRRLYDTETSRYVTLEEIAERVPERRRR